jgi:CRP-like cAMP-binding protein
MKAVFKSTGGKDPVKENILTFSAGARIFSEGELGTEMYIIQDGEVHICKRLGTDSHVLSQLQKGDFFGEMAVLESTPRTADAIAHTDVRLILINGSRFDEMIRKNPEIAVRIMRKYAKRLREANVLLERFAGHGFDVDNVATMEAPPPPPRDKAQRKRLVDVATGDAFFLSKEEETMIGRSDPVTGIMPDIDLTSVDNNRSVSRRHAKILRKEGRYFMLEEVGTVNGTYVNDQKIATGVQVEIKNGDRVRIGLIQMKAVFD